MSDPLPEAPPGLSTHTSTDVPGASADAAPTPLLDAVAAEPAGPTRVFYRGAQTVACFSDAQREVRALLETAAVHDAGWLRRVEIRGEDRLRWLNGMLTNSVQGLLPGQGNYNFALNAQGRIQGDACVFRIGDDRLLLQTSADQFPRLLAHFDRFIIMDDVELVDLSGQWTALGVAGPAAPALLARLGLDPPAAETGNVVLTLREASLDGEPIQIVHTWSPRVPRYELWFAPQRTMAVWNALTSAGAIPAGLTALEGLRVFEGAPLYGVDIHDRDLPQETTQLRALHFNKGCYLGQEIVERIRSRGNVHRRLAQFSLTAPPAHLPVELTAGSVVGHITSAAVLGPSVYGLGLVRVEALERKLPLEYVEGAAVPLEKPPSPQF